MMYCPEYLNNQSDPAGPYDEDTVELYLSGRIGFDLVAVVDWIDYYYLQLWRYRWWFNYTKSGTAYVRGYLKRDRNRWRGEMVYLHTLIKGKREGYQVDHIDNDVLNNRWSNLQWLPIEENAAKRMRRKSTDAGNT